MPITATSSTVIPIIILPPSIAPLTILPVKVFADSGTSIFISFSSGVSVSGSIILAIIIALGIDNTVAPTKCPAIVGILSLRSDTYKASIDEAIVDIKTVKIKKI